METTLRWTSADLERLPENGKRYEIIDGELLVSKAPSYHHQYTCGKCFNLLDTWSAQTRLGQPNIGAGIVFADDDDVIPDVVWTSRERLRQILGSDGHFHHAPELVIEVLSIGSANEQRDRETKLKLYSRRGVEEHWIVNWLIREIEVYRRKRGRLKHIATLHANDTLTSPLLPGFKCQVSEIFEDYLDLPR